MLRDNLDGVRQRIRRACQRCGRNSSSVTLVCVTKGVPVEVIREAVTLGVTDVGENRVQEASGKRGALGPQVRWHMVGHVQRNKAKAAVALFDVIHSVDSSKLIEELERHAAAQGRAIDVLVQVNLSGESTKSGCRESDVARLLSELQRSAHLRAAGLMTIPPLADDPGAARPHFRALRQLRDRAGAGSVLKLSMGMSNDFEVAIEEGADMVRIGTAIFGTRR